MRAMAIRVCLAVLTVLISFAAAGFVQAQGGDERELVRLPKHVSQPAWIGPTTILATLTGAAYGNREVAVIDLSTREMRVLAQGGCASPSPDRTKAAWVPGPATRGDVWIMDLRSGERRRLTDGRGAGCVVWSPDGRRLAVVSTNQTGASSKDDILLLDAMNGRVEDTIANNELYLNYPAWSPDSQRLVFAAYTIDLFPARNQINRIFPISRIDVFALRERRRSVYMQVSADHTAADLAFSPDGRLLAMAIGGQLHLHDGTVTRRLTDGRNPIWYPDGGSILFSRGYDCTGYLCAGDALYAIRLP